MPNMTPTKELSIHQANDELQIQIDRLGKISEELCMRLEKVCCPQPPQIQEANKAVPESQRSEFAEQQYRRNMQIKHISELLENTLGRLEL